MSTTLYQVKAVPKKTEINEFREKLTDGTIRDQEPDGREIVESMKRAVMINGRVEWYETCYCTPPLRHERTTVYDKYFSEMEIEPVSKVPDLKGESFWKRLETLKSAKGGTHHGDSGMTVKSQYLPSTSRML